MIDMMPKDLDELIATLINNGWEYSGTQSYANGVFYTNLKKGNEKVHIEYNCFSDEYE